MGSKNHVVDGATWQIRDIDPRMADPVRLYATLQLLICSSLPFRNELGPFCRLPAASPGGG